jgi:hypothetical protein
MYIYDMYIRMCVCERERERERERVCVCIQALVAWYRSCVSEAAEMDGGKGFEGFVK